MSIANYRSVNLIRSSYIFALSLHYTFKYDSDLHVVVIIVLDSISF